MRWKIIDIRVTDFNIPSFCSPRRSLHLCASALETVQKVTAVYLLLTCILLFLAPLPGRAADWPQFRGPAANGIAPDTGLTKDWAKHPPKARWTVPLTDNGFAGPAVAHGVVYLVDHQGTRDIVRALSLTTGQERWRFAYPDASPDVYGHARATPAIYDGKVYTLSQLGLVHCLDARTGKKRWARDIAADFHGVRPQWGYAMSPLVDGDALILCPGGKGATVVALDRRTGATRWQSGRDDIPGYSTPVVATLSGRKQYVVFAGAALLGFDAATGVLRWRFPWKTDLDPVIDSEAARAHLNANAAAPIVDGDTIFITTGYGHGSALLKVTGDKPVCMWTSKEMQSQYSSPIYSNGYLYCTSDPHHLVCLSITSGQVAWKSETYNRGGGVVAANGMLFVEDGGRGEIVMVRMTPACYQEVGRFKPLGGETRTAPIIADGYLLVRNRKALACVPLK